MLFSSGTKGRKSKSPTISNGTNDISGKSPTIPILKYDAPVPIPSSNADISGFSIDLIEMDA